MYVFPFWLSPVDQTTPPYHMPMKKNLNRRLGLTFFLFVGGTFPRDPCPFVFVISEGSSLRSTLF
jgi:hypothetical protein